MLSMLQMPSFIQPYYRLIKGEEPSAQLKTIMAQIGLPLLGIWFFLIIWSQLAGNITTSSGKFPDPSSVYIQAKNLWSEHVESRENKKVFYAQQDKINATKLNKNPDYSVEKRLYTGAPTFIDQIVTSLITMLSGFLLATLIAIPVGIIIGLTPALQRATNLIIQILKPVSPLAWLPLVTMVVGAIYVNDEPFFAKSFMNSAITVALCSLWPILINTTIGVSMIEKDLNNVSKVLRLSWLSHIKNIVLPSSVPMIFSGLRLSLGIAWMVLITAEMLSQNPGLGKFVWDECQNGSSSSLSRILVAVLTIGLIGCIFDKIMVILQRFVSWDKNSPSL